MKFSSVVLAACIACIQENAHAFTASKRLSVSKQQPHFQKRQTIASRSALIGQRKKNNGAVTLFGILDEVMSDDYNLMSTSEESQVNMNDAYEIFLGDLVFSTNDPRLDIVENYERATAPEFLEWMEKKIEKSKDPEERLALRDLLDMILDIKKKQELSKMAEERKAKEEAAAEQERLAKAEEEAAAGRQLTNADVLRKAQAIDSATAATAEDRAEAASKKKSFYEQEITPEIRMSYEDTLKQLLPPYKGGETPESIVKTNYDKFDAQFVKVLNERVTVDNDQDSAALLEALATEQSRRIGIATENLKSVLAMGEPMKMEGAIIKMAREGKVDESFLLLLEANETQARDAGANGPAELMKRLRLRAVEEKDKQMASKEIALIRKLLRADDAAAREKILVDAFTPRENLLVAGTAENAAKAMDGDVPDKEQPMPDVPPPDFINACKAVMLNFGNLQYDDDRGDLATRIKQLASEAEVVATRIYGQGMSLREQQDRAWKEQTTSIFDLEQMELEAESRGEHAPWTNPDADDDMFLPGFDAQGKMKIGGG
ncbi:hypothetical protein IV203_006175 [Nitzschia inconspicua]|uniref:Uncharacterized protein n=1 Tax=Nitzschia inconspicua TaxID=303405 RepID=A0A9K3KPL9_9STRA|nr:hypothetical protein IV203_030469 [Nitzschia inconspicua]KAG7347106.1 hypothetical protein IV203_006175 [Nitzschia inconspicua]